MPDNEVYQQQTAAPVTVRNGGSGKRAAPDAKVNSESPVTFKATQRQIAMLQLASETFVLSVSEVIRRAVDAWFLEHRDQLAQSIDGYLTKKQAELDEERDALRSLL